MRRALRGARHRPRRRHRPGLAAARSMRLAGQPDLAGRAWRRPLRRGTAGRARASTTWPVRGRARHPARRAGPGRRRPRSLFTSGATGPAKGVVYRHRQVRAQLRAARGRRTASRPSDRLVAAFAPFALLGPALGIASAVPDIDVTTPGTLTAPRWPTPSRAVDATRGVRLPGRAAPTSSRPLPALTAAAGGGARPGAAADVAPVRRCRSRCSSDAHPAADGRGAHPVRDDRGAAGHRHRRSTRSTGAGTGDGVCVGRPLPGRRGARSARSTPLGAADGAADRPTPDVTGEICVAPRTSRTATTRCGSPSGATVARPGLAPHRRRRAPRRRGPAVGGGPAAARHHHRRRRGHAGRRRAARRDADRRARPPLRSASARPAPRSSRSSWCSRTRRRAAGGASVRTGRGWRAGADRAVRAAAGPRWPPC